MTSVEIKVLISLAALGSVYAFVRDIQHGNRKRRLVKWVRDHYPAEWRALHWGQRNLFPEAGLLLLHRSGAIPDPHFAREYSLTKRWPKDTMVAFAVACAAVALAILGKLYLGWIL